MPGRLWFDRSGVLTLVGWCLLVICIAPASLDAAPREEFAPSPLHQPAWVDGEEADPFEPSAVPVSPDDQLQSFSPVSDLKNKQGSPVIPGRFTSPQCVDVVSLSSRPPPVS
jgi:hypothetical protein